MWRIPGDQNRISWATWLNRLLSGDDWCEWRAWFQAHHYSDSWTRADTNFDNVRWKMEHSRLLWESREGLEEHGYTVWVEKQNKFWVDGACATVSGQPNLVVKKDIDITVMDVKTGTPRQWGHYPGDAIHVWSGAVRYCLGRYYSEREGGLQRSCCGHSCRCRKP